MLYRNRFSYLYPRMDELTMFDCLFPILNSEYRTTMQTPQTLQTLLLYPNRTIISHFYCTHRTLLGTRPTSDTSA